VGLAAGGLVVALALGAPPPVAGQNGGRTVASRAAADPDQPAGVSGPDGSGTAETAPDAAYREGLAAVAAGDDATALDRFEAALAAAPNDLPAADAYRKAVIAAGAYDRAIAFFDRLTAEHPDAAYAWLNLGYAYVDKIPTAGSITRVILADRALSAFSRSLAIEQSWIGLFTRGNSYLYWPKVFGRAPLAVADLEQAVALSEAAERPLAVHVRAWIALGDAYWKTDRPDRARDTWRRALERFPGDPQLEARLSRDGEQLDRYLYDQLDPNERVDTDLEPLWAEER
jgi:tetratricopeptide (TPR) repeat protein